MSLLYAVCLSVNASRQQQHRQHKLQQCTGASTFRSHCMWEHSTFLPPLSSSPFLLFHPLLCFFALSLPSPFPALYLSMSASIPLAPFPVNPTSGPGEALHFIVRILAHFSVFKRLWETGPFIPPAMVRHSPSILPLPLPFFPLSSPLPLEVKPLNPVRGFVRAL